MTFNTRSRWSTAILVKLGALVVATTLGAAAEQRFLPDDPIQVDLDTQDASGMKPLDVNLFVDFATNVITARRPAEPGRARNVNTIDEVPDSSWFTNRAGTRPLSVEDIMRGPNRDNGPKAGAWTVTSSKSDGVTPGFTIKDADGVRWFLKFDPPGYRGMSTGTEVTATKLMWALGYHVPENHVAYLRREQLVVGEGAKVTPPSGKTRRMRLGDIDEMLARVDREPDGTYRVVASRALDGKPIGRIRFDGTRPDDPNDIVPHQHRRELRGYGTFAAWLNHVDAKSINSLDTLVTEHGRSFVRHHLIDFGSSLGSGGLGPADYWAGHEHVVEKPALARMVGFGLAGPSYRRTAFHEAASVGRLPLANATFDPDAWKPRLPNPAFLHARADDKFWAARKLMALSTDLLRAAVRSGDFDDPASEDVLVQVLADRRDAIGRTYLTALNPISDPALTDEGGLSFTNVAVDLDLARAPEYYTAIWSTFDNATGGTRVLGRTTGRTTTLPAPQGLPAASGAYVMVDIRATAPGHPSWEQPVRAFFTRTDRAWKLVGFERMPDRMGRATGPFAAGPGGAGAAVGANSANWAN